MTDVRAGSAEGSTLRGVVPIPVTTFGNDGALDLAGLRSQVEFCLGHGADGILYPGVVSEFYAHRRGTAHGRGDGGRCGRPAGAGSGRCDGRQH